MSDAPADTATTDAPTNDPAQEPDTGTDLVAEVEKWKAQARKHEERAKANAAAAKERDELRRSAMSEQEQAVAQAVDQARADTLRQVGGQLVAAEIRAAAAGRSTDLDALVEGIDPTKFLDDTGQVDRDAVKAWVDRIAPAQQQDTLKPTGLEVFDIGQGLNAAPPADPLLSDIKTALGI